MKPLMPPTPFIALLGVLVFWGGIAVAERRYPAEFDWRYMTLSTLISPRRNPAVLRRADCEVLTAAARLRKQSLHQFVREVLEVAAVALRTPPAAPLTWGDIYFRHPEPSPELGDAEVRVACASQALQPTSPLYWASRQALNRVCSK